MEPRIFAIADELEGEIFGEGRPADLVERYARRLPLSVICELLGLPPADRPKFMAWTKSFTRLTGAIGFLGLIPAVAAMKRYLEARLESARREGGDGLIAELARVEKEGERISAREMVAMVFLLLGAGSETTTHLISGSVYELVRNPEFRESLIEDWCRANLAIEEFLRFISPVRFTKPRFVRREVDLAGVRLRKGGKIMAMRNAFVVVDVQVASGQGGRHPVLNRRREDDWSDDDRSSGGDRRRRSDRADVGRRIGVGAGQRCHYRAARQPGPHRLSFAWASFTHDRNLRSARHR
jgi:hypothetical protein